MYGDVPVALIRNALLLAGFGSMYFAVTSMTDADNRHQFFAPILDEVERILAVHAVYLSVRDVVLPDAPARPAPSGRPGAADAPVTDEPAPRERGGAPDPAARPRRTRRNAGRPSRRGNAGGPQARQRR